MTTAKRRLRVLEELFIGQVERHVGQVLPQFTQRFNADELRAIADFLRCVAHEPHDPAAAATGAGLLAQWRAELSSERWAAMWLLPDVLSSVDAALSLSPTEL